MDMYRQGAVDGLEMAAQICDEIAKKKNEVDVELSPDFKMVMNATLAIAKTAILAWKKRASQTTPDQG